MTRKKSELTPTENIRPVVTHAKEIAGGIPAIMESMKHVFGESGVVRGTDELLHMNQFKGFDCPGCAWPDPDDRRSVVEFCENGAKAVAEETTTKKVDPKFFVRHSVEELGGLSDYEIGKEGRLTHPMWLRENGTHYEPITWEETFKIIAQELNGLKSPDEAIFYTSGRTSNEAAFVYQLFARIFGTNNMPDCSNMCHESSGVALSESIGVGKGSVRLEDIHEADCLMIVGQNPGTNHPRMLTALQIAAKNGAKVISVNPLFETGLKHFKHPQKFWQWFGRGTPIATMHMPVRLSGDIALFKGIMKELLAKEEDAPGTVFNGEFIQKSTSGFEAFIKDLKTIDWNLIVEQSGISREQISAAADIVANSKKMIICYAMGLTQQKHGVECIQELVNLLLLGGHFGRAGAGICPVRGHSNVQGDRTMGIYERPTTEFLNALAKEFNFEPPRKHGWDSVNSIHALHRGEAKIFFGMGGNFLSAAPDTEYTATALRNARLTVHVSTKLNRSHLVHGKQALILPCYGRSDIDTQASGPQFVTVEDSMGKVHSSRGNLKPRSDLQKSEVAIVAGLALETFRDQIEKSKLVRWRDLEGNYDLIRDHIEKVVPGFKDFNKRVTDTGGFYLPHAVHDDLIFHTKSDKGQFMTYPIPIVKVPEGSFMLTTIRSHDQFNTTIYGLNDRYRGVSNGRRVIFMNEEDIAKQGLQVGQWVDVTSHFEGEKRMAPKFMVVKYEIPRQCVAAYYPEANVLVPIGSVVGRSNTPTYKSIVVTVAPSMEIN
jgi:molybdopterin-dependent oxidoreductase alpha subunit